MVSNAVEESEKPGKTRHNVLLDEPTKRRADDMATEDLRSFNNFLSWLINEEWKRRIPPNPNQKELAV